MTADLNWTGERMSTDWIYTATILASVLSVACSVLAIRVSRQSMRISEESERISVDSISLSTKRIQAIEMAAREQADKQFEAEIWPEDEIK